MDKLTPAAAALILVAMAVSTIAPLHTGAVVVGAVFSAGDIAAWRSILSPSSVSREKANQ